MWPIALATSNVVTFGNIWCCVIALSTASAVPLVNCLWFFGYHQEGDKNHQYFSHLDGAILRRGKWMKEEKKSEPVSLSITSLCIHCCDHFNSVYCLTSVCSKKWIFGKHKRKKKKPVTLWQLRVRTVLALSIASAQLSEENRLLIDWLLLATK